MNKLTIDDLSKLGLIKSKKVLMRVDFNVPMSKDEVPVITDDKRIKESLPSINKIINEGGRLILMSHLGRPKGEVNLKYSLKPVAVHLSKLINKNVKFADDCTGENTQKIVNELNNGDVLLLENVRFHKEEEKNDVEFSKQLAALGDIFVNDAFGSAHRAHSSTEGITKFIGKSAAGYLMQKELDYLSKVVSSPEHPFIAILGGSKISGKIDVINNLLKKADKILIGGGMIFTFFKALGLEIGKSLLEEDKINLASDILSKSEDKIVLPVDVVIADKFENDAKIDVVNYDEIPDNMIGMDIGPGTIELFENELNGAKTIVWNGPMGVFEMENFAAGTFEIAKALAKETKNGAITVIGGGDSASAVAKAGLKDDVSHVSTGGGASLEYLEGKILPGVAALTDK